MKNKGITLIALVITIVVLIMLAAVAINLSLGNNGIFNRAKSAKEKYANSQEYEEKQVDEYGDRIDEYASFSRAGSSYISYSTDEQDTGLTWVNGDKIYQKSLKFTSSTTVTANTWFTIPVTAPSNIKDIISGVMYRDIHSGPVYVWGISRTSNTIRIQSPIQFDCGTNTYLTIQYTKNS